MAEAHELTMVEQAAAVRARELSPVELTEHYLRRIERLDGDIGAYLTVTPDRALDDARRAERRLLDARDGRGGGGGDGLPPLLGVALPVKDLDAVPGIRCTYGSAVFDGHVAPDGSESHLVGLLRRAGTVMLGKTNTPEFGLPAYTESAVGPPARSPYDPERGAGGSSGGAAAAVAAGLAPAAHGSDGGGSIRIPASCCGIVGLKPSRGRISPAPRGDASGGLATPGPLARTVRDAAALLDVMAVQSPGDPTPLAAPATPFLRWCDREPGRLRIGRWARPDVPGVTVEPEVLAAYEKTSALLAGLGHEVVDIEQPLRPGDRDAFTPVWAVLAAVAPVPAGRESGLLPLTRWLREQGRAASGLDYVRALDTMQTVGRRLAEAVAPYDAVLTPALARLPVPVGALRNDADPAADFETQIAFTPFTGPWNIAGLPAVSLPAGWTDDGLPVGMMLGAPHGAEGPLLSLAAQLESACAPAPQPWGWGPRPRVW